MRSLGFYIGAGGGITTPLSWRNNDGRRLGGWRQGRL